MADMTFHKSRFGRDRPLRQPVNNVVYYAFVACFFWAASQLIGLVFNVSGVLEHLLQNQANQRPEVLISPLSGTLFGGLAFAALAVIVLALMAVIRWYQRRD